MASGAFAAPAYPGYTGLIFTPTADTLNMGAVNAGASYISGDDDSDISYFSANIGVINGLEAGLGYQNPEVGDSETIINAKYAIMKESFATPGVAVGVSDLSDEIDSTPYVAVSKTLDVPGLAIKSLRGTVGLGSGTLDGIFGGLSAVITDKVTFMIEHDTDDLNLGLQFAGYAGLRAHVDLIGGDDVGFGLNFNKGF